jgi:uncharacterized OB-fold protein
VSATEGGGPTKAVPVPTPDTARYWEATRRGELWIQRCDGCATAYFYPRNGCPHCSSTNVTWERVSGRARLHTYVINHRPATGFVRGVPYAIAVVELEEGPRMMSNIVGVDITPEALELDMALVVDFEPRGDQMVPVFRPERTP